MKNIVILLFVSLSAMVNLAAQTSVTRLWYIGDAKMACNNNNTITSCLKIKVHPDSSWRGFPHEIEGFIFEPGMESYIELLETEIPVPQENGPKYTYKLVKVIESKSTVLKDKRLLANNKWKLINIEKNRTVIPSKRSTAYLVFHIDSNKLQGFGGCNSLGGNVQIVDGEMSFGVMSSTMMSCANDEVEKELKAALVGRAAYYVHNNMLFIVCENLSILHLRPEKKLDSIISVINKPPARSVGNVYSSLKNGDFFVELQHVPEAGAGPFVFRAVSLTAAEKKTIRYKLQSVASDSKVSELHIMIRKKAKTPLNYATVIFRDGTRKEILIENVN